MKRSAVLGRRCGRFKVEGITVGQRIGIDKWLPSFVNARTLPPRMVLFHLRRTMLQSCILDQAMQQELW